MMNKAKMMKKKLSKTGACLADFYQEAKKGFSLNRETAILINK
jgi:hypothetical protein